MLRVKNIYSKSPSGPYGPKGKEKPSFIDMLQYWAGGQNRAAYIKTRFRVLSPPQCQSQAVVCVSTPKMYPRSRYFLVSSKKMPFNGAN